MTGSVHELHAGQPGVNPNLSPVARASTRWFVTIPPEGAARTVALHTAQALAKVAGNDAVKTFDTAVYLTAFTSLLASPSNDMVVDMLNQSLVVQALDFGATRLLVPALSPVTLFSLSLLRKLGVVTIHWFYEDFRRAQYWRDVVRGYDLFLAIQRGDVERACAAAGVGFDLLPTAVASSSLVNKQPGGRTVDVAFVGTPSSYRVRALGILQKHGFSLTIAGSGWSEYRGPLERCIAASSWVDDAAGAAILRRAKIVVNISNTDPQSDRDNTHISPRAFEAMSQGCVLVTENVPLAHDVLRGYHFHVFNDDQEMVRVVRNVLDEYDSGQAKIEENLRRVTDFDTYECRARTIIRVAESTRRETHPRQA